MDSTFDKVLCFICSIRSIKVTRELFKHFEMLTMGYRTDFLKTYPQLVDQSGSIPIEYSWSGLMGYAEHMMPEIGPLEKDLWACTSFGGHGVNTAPIGARLVAEGLCGASERWRTFEPFGFPWNGGFLGPFAVESSYRKMQLGDHWRAFRSRW